MAVIRLVQTLLGVTYAPVALAIVWQVMDNHVMVRDIIFASL